MQPEHAISRIARKEITQFFASPVAFVFLATFLAVTLFVFFWVDAFFARNLADVRPLFNWMPILLVFLVAALTMRMWSEERRQGTLEFLLTTPVGILRLVLGKFLACLALLLIALALTLPLPITVSLLGNLDWGPVIGGYVATLFLGAAYIAIGLYVSARSDSQIVSLIVTALVGILFWLIGSGPHVGLLSYEWSELLRKLGTGSRFESITRGVLDIRDLYYYLSLVGVFLTLNVLALRKEGWAQDNHSGEHRRWHLFAGLLIANLLAANIWLDQVKTLRADLTADQRYSLSEATGTYLDQLQEPLLIRGYFSAKTHPLLAPLIPQLRDLLKEYEVAGDGRVRVEFIDPQTDPEKEDEANSKYNIRPVPFQVADRYQSGLVNSYFHVLLSYGDQYEVLSFRDLIEVKEKGEGQLDVRLRNPEYDVTRALKKVLHAYQTGGNLFATLNKPVTLHAYISPDDKLPAELVPFRATLEKVVKEAQAQSRGKLAYKPEDPDAEGGKLAKQLTEEFGIQPLFKSLLGTDTFWFTLLLTDGEQYVQLALPEKLDEENLKKNLEAGIKRFSSGFTKTVAMLVPEQAQGP
ncbi:MAG: ABC transporter permease, partial [Gammaproteobacteria bacterium]